MFQMFPTFPFPFILRVDSARKYREVGFYNINWQVGNLVVS